MSTLPGYWLLTNIPILLYGRPTCCYFSAVQANEWLPRSYHYQAVRGPGNQTGGFLGFRYSAQCQVVLESGLEVTQVSLPHLERFYIVAGYFMTEWSSPEAAVILSRTQKSMMTE